MGLTKQFWEQEQEEEKILMRNYVNAFKDRFSREIKELDEEQFYNKLLMNLSDEFCLEAIGSDLEEQIYRWWIGE